MGDIISLAADIFKDTVELVAEHPRETAEVAVVGAALVAGYYKGRYDERQDTDDKNYLPAAR